MHSDHFQWPVHRILEFSRNRGPHWIAALRWDIASGELNRLPIIRMTNISILAGQKPLTLEQLIASTDHGILFQTNRSWSIDDKRYNFQFGTEIGWELKNGK